jgi:hypothetical protein
VPALWINRSIQIGVGRRQRDWPENGALNGASSADRAFL